MIEKKIFGNIGEKDIYYYTINNNKGESVNILNYGGIVQALNVKNANGGLTDAVLGYDFLQPYINNEGYLGAIIGRYANRIKDAKFTLNGKQYNLYKNNGNNHLHGGKIGFDKKIWQAETDNNTLLLHIVSVDGDEGYPGNLDVTARYTFTDNSELIIEYNAAADNDTIVNLTNHSYFNLNGEGDILSHFVKINSDTYIATDSESIPVKKQNVTGTPFDFRQGKQIGKDITKDDIQLNYAKGYDHNYVLSGNISDAAAEVWSEVSGIKMLVFTDKPGMQFYSGNYLNGVKGKYGKIYNRHCGFCMETQHYPDSINNPQFPSPVIKAGQEYKYTTIYRFSNI